MGTRQRTSTAWDTGISGKPASLRSACGYPLVYEIPGLFRAGRVVCFSTDPDFACRFVARLSCK
jgi:hypothetical protein